MNSSYLCATFSCPFFLIKLSYGSWISIFKTLDKNKEHILVELFWDCFCLCLHLQTTIVYEDSIFRFLLLVQNHVV